jgi:hypothetical protein
MKGKVAWNKGKRGIYSPETIEKMRTKLMGRTPWNKGKRGGISPWKGKKFTPEQLRSYANLI